MLRRWTKHKGKDKVELQFTVRFDELSGVPFAYESKYLAFKWHAGKRSGITSATTEPVSEGRAKWSNSSLTLYINLYQDQSTKEFDQERMKLKLQLVDAPQRDSGNDPKKRRPKRGTTIGTAEFNIAKFALHESATDTRIPVAIMRKRHSLNFSSFPSSVPSGCELVLHIEGKWTKFNNMLIGPPTMFEECSLLAGSGSINNAGMAPTVSDTGHDRQQPLVIDINGLKYLLQRDTSSRSQSTDIEGEDSETVVSDSHDSSDEENETMSSESNSPTNQGVSPQQHEGMKHSTSAKSLKDHVRKKLLVASSPTPEDAVFPLEMSPSRTGNRSRSISSGVDMLARFETLSRNVSELIDREQIIADMREQLRGKEELRKAFDHLELQSRSLASQLKKKVKEVDRLTEENRFVVEKMHAQEEAHKQQLAEATARWEKERTALEEQLNMLRQSLAGELNRRESSERNFAQISTECHKLHADLESSLQARVRDEVNALQLQVVQLSMNLREAELDRQKYASEADAERDKLLREEKLLNTKLEELGSALSSAQKNTEEEHAARVAAESELRRIRDFEVRYNGEIDKLKHALELKGSEISKLNSASAEEREKLLEKLAAANAAAEDARRQLAEHHTTAEETIKQCQKEAATEIAELRAQLEIAAEEQRRLNSEVQQYKHDLDQAKQYEKALRSEIEDSKRREASLREVYRQLEQQNEQADAIRKQETALNEELVKYRDQLDALQKQLTQAIKDREDLYASLDDQRRITHMHETYIAEQRDALAKAQCEIEELKHQRNTLQEHLTTAEKDNCDLREALAQTTTKVFELNKAYQTLESALRKAEQEARDLFTEVEQLRSENARHREQSQEVEEIRSRNAAFQREMQEPVRELKEQFQTLTEQRTSLATRLEQEAAERLKLSHDLEQSTKELEALTNELSSARKRIQETEADATERLAFEIQRRKAVETALERVQNEVTNVKHELRSAIAELERVRRGSEESLAAAKRKLDEANLQRRHLEQQLDLLQAHIEQERAKCEQLQSTLETTRKTLEEALEQQKANLARTEEELRHKHSAYQQLQQLVQEGNDKVALLEETIGRMQHEIADGIATRQRLEEELNTALTKLVQLEREKSAVEHQLAGLSLQLSTAHNALAQERTAHSVQLRELRNEKEHLELLLAELQHSIDQAKEDYGQVVAQLEDSTRTQTVLNAKIEELEARNRAMSGDMEILRASLRRIQGECAVEERRRVAAERRMEEMSMAIEGAERRIASLTTELESTQRELANQQRQQQTMEYQPCTVSEEEHIDDMIQSDDRLQAVQMEKERELAELHGRYELLEADYQRIRKVEEAHQKLQLEVNQVLEELNTYKTENAQLRADNAQQQNRIEQLASEWDRSLCKVKELEEKSEQFARAEEELKFAQALLDKTKTDLDSLGTALAQERQARETASVTAENLRSELAEIAHRYREDSAKKEALSKQLAAIETAYKQALEELKYNHSKELDAAHTRLCALQQEQATLVESLKQQHAAELKAMQNELDTLRETYDREAEKLKRTLFEQNALFESKLRAVEAKYRTAEAAWQVKETQWRTRESALRETQQQKEALLSIKNALEDELALVRDALRYAEVERFDAQLNLKGVMEKVSMLEAKLKETENTAEQLVQRLATSDERIKSHSPLHLSHESQPLAIRSEPYGNLHRLQYITKRVARPKPPLMTPANLQRVKYVVLGTECLLVLLLAIAAAFATTARLAFIEIPT